VRVCALALLGDDWIVLWYSNATIDKNERPKTLYPKHMSTVIFPYWKEKIIKAVRSTVSGSLKNRNPIQKRLKLVNENVLDSELERNRLPEISCVPCLGFLYYLG
jgi:hypothetical protein